MNHICTKETFYVDAIGDKMKYETLFAKHCDVKDLQEPHKNALSLNAFLQIMKEIESNRLKQLVMPTAGSKPALGVMPHINWLEKRITELSRALYEYFNNGYYDDNTYKWLMELYNVYRQRDRYIEEQQKVKGFSA